jgi:predicted HTH transcriptional regulator
MYMYIKGHIETEATLTWPKVRSEKPPEITMHFDGHEGFTMKSDAPKLTNTQQQIMRVINDPRNQAVTLSEIMAASSADDKQRKTFENAIGDLVKLGYVVRLGQGRTTAYGRASGGVPQDAGIFKL